MFGDPGETVEALLALKARYGDLNAALVCEYVRANGVQSTKHISKAVGLSRNVVRRALSHLDRA